jgi:hypothetical protein
MIKMDMAVKRADKKGCPMKIQPGQVPVGIHEPSLP